MAIKFLNVRTKEVRVAETEPQITALWSNSDHSPNVTQGQDFGWRLAPEVIVEMRRISKDPQILESIAARTNRPIEDIKEPEILNYISAKTRLGDEPLADESDYTDEYQQEIRRLELQEETKTSTSETVTTTTTESLEDMRERVALAERLAAAQSTTTTTTVAPTTTTTTTKAK